MVRRDKHRHAILWAKRNTQLPKRDGVKRRKRRPGKPPYGPRKHEPHSELDDGIMADITTKLSDQDVTLKDVTDPAYVPPSTGYVIELTDAQSRLFIRLGELARLRENRDRDIFLRDDANAQITQLNTTRTEVIAKRDALNASIIEANTRIQELVDWLQSQGDPTG
jgi:hypothetical protein